jgi:hypothetical protein
VSVFGLMVERFGYAGPFVGAGVGLSILAIFFQARLLALRRGSAEKAC